MLGSADSEEPLMLPLEAIELDAFRRRHHLDTFWCGLLLDGCGARLTTKLYTDRVCHFAHHPGPDGQPHICGRRARVAVCAAHQASEHGRDDLHTRVLAALGALHTVVRPVAEAGVREFQPGYTAAVLEFLQEAPEPYGPGTPVFGWRTFHSVDSNTTWDDTIDTATWNSSTMMSGFLGYFDDVPELQPPQLAQLLRDHGVPVVLCAGCEDPITDRHLRWSGVWVSPGNDTGPLCKAPTPALKLPEPRCGWLTDAQFCHPHQPAPMAD